MAYVACTWNQSGMSFWEDYADGAQPYLEVPADSLDDWPFNLSRLSGVPGAESCGGRLGWRRSQDGDYPADMLVDYVRVWASP
jgi:hypothetical protein